jgi:hypothetical protein
MFVNYHFDFVGRRMRFENPSRRIYGGMLGTRSRTHVFQLDVSGAGVPLVARWSRADRYVGVIQNTGHNHIIVYVDPFGRVTSAIWKYNGCPVLLQRHGNATIAVLLEILQEWVDENI